MLAPASGRFKFPHQYNAKGCPPTPMAKFLVRVRPAASSKSLVPFSIGALCAIVFCYSWDFNLRDHYSSLHRTRAEVQPVALSTNDALFEELWKENESLVWMSREEAQMVVQYLQPEHTMWEWGSGGSTTFFPHFVANYYSVEHDATWFASVKERIAADPFLANTVTYKYVPSVPYQRVWPGPPSEGANYAQYIRAVPEGLKVDRFFIDGRVRPQCAIEALFHFRDPGDSIVFIHDFWDIQQRGHYKLVLLFYDMIDTVLDRQSLVVLRAKPDWRERLRRFMYPEWWEGNTADGSLLPIPVIRLVN